jgi:porin
MRKSCKYDRFAGAAAVGAAIFLSGAGYAADSTGPGDLDSAARAAAINAKLGYRGWDIPFPSYADSLSKDYAGYRSTLAQYGFGFVTFNGPLVEDNLLNTPRTVPSTFPTKCAPNAAITGQFCAGGRAYFGQRLDAADAQTMVLTYDTSRWGVPDGLLAIGAEFVATSDPVFLPAEHKMQLLSWYQTAFDRRVELEFGYLQGSQEIIGQTVGGNIFSPFGPSGAIPALNGLSTNSEATPMARATVVITGDLKNGFYDEPAVQRSLPVRGISSNAFTNEVLNNPTGFNFFSSEPGTRAVFVDEFGYRQQSKPGQLNEWFRTGVLYNNSTFTDLSKVLKNPSATVDGSGALVYALADQQITQPDKTQPGRGIYAGATYMYANPQTSAITQYSEARVYWKGPFDSRPTDMISLIYSHNQVSKYVNAQSAFLAPAAAIAPFTNAYTVSYNIHAFAGVYFTIGVSYIDNPSTKYFPGEGSALNLLASTFVVF